MAAILSDYQAALKEVLLPFIQDNFPRKTILLDQLKRNSGVNMMNDEFIAPIRTSRHGGIVNLANDGNSVISSNGISFTRGTVSVESITGAFDISRLSVKASEGNSMAVESALTTQATTLAEDFARDINRQLYHDGIGILTKVRGTGGSVGAGTIAVEQPDANLDDGRSIDWYGTVNGDISPVKYIAPGQILGIGSVAADLGTVTSVTGTSIVMTGSPASAVDDSVYKVDGSGGGAGTSEFLGIRAALSSTTGTSTYAGVARNITGWTPQFGSASEALSLTRLEDSYISATEYAQTEDKYVILLNKTLFRKYGDILTAMRRTVNQTDLLGGFKGLEFAAGGNVVGVFLDFDVPDGEALIINLDTWTICQVSDLELVDGDELSSMLRLQNTLTYQQIIAWYANVFCLAPAANGRQTRKTA